MPKAGKRVFQAPTKSLTLPVFRRAVEKRRQAEATVQERVDARNRVREEARRLAEEQERARQQELNRIREKELELQREAEREKERVREEELRRIRELEREKELERERELEKQRELERQKERERELELERERERERERENQRAAEAAQAAKKAKLASSKRPAENGSKLALEKSLSGRNGLTSVSEPTDMDTGDDSLAPDEDNQVKLELEAKLAKLAGEKHHLMLQLKQALSAESSRPKPSDGRPRDVEPTSNTTQTSTSSAAQPSSSEPDVLEEGEYRSHSPALQVPPPPPLLPPPPPSLKSQALPPPPPLPPHLHQTQVAAAKAAAVAAAQAVSSSSSSPISAGTVPSQRSPGPRLGTPGQSNLSAKSPHLNAARPSGAPGITDNAGSSSMHVPLPALQQPAKVNGLPAPAALVSAQKSNPSPGSPGCSNTYLPPNMGLRPAQVEQLQRIQKAAQRQQAIIQSKGAPTGPASGNSHPPHGHQNGACASSSSSPLPPHNLSQGASSSGPYHAAHNGPHNSVHPSPSHPRSHLQPPPNNGYTGFNTLGKASPQGGAPPAGGPGWVPGPWQLQKSNGNGSNGGGNGVRRP
ncbi:hypothetical protein CYMTET_31279 [Cymbomonas tetramitiformis]|uniref:Uncharacterized protein n=1 Tax=Cymbomonas tetramitiformis TaxID=36881 RepID=A0AAE0FH49_9CHLO|nr:hypothetical protein CYMTET_31279 [Cymbomonas tetramitiformis]